MTSTEDTDLDPTAAGALRSRVGEYLDGTREGRGLRVGVVCGKFNGAITLRLVEGALDALGEAGVERSAVSLAWAPGAFEIPLTAKVMAEFIATQLEARMPYRKVVKNILQKVMEK